MATCAVRSFLKVSEAPSDSDDEDKLHIVEDDSITDNSEEKPTVFQQLHKGHTLNDGNLGPDALIQEIRVKEECITDEEDEEVHINEASRQEKTEVICPDIPKEENSTPERGVPDENGTPDDLSQLHSCPYCSRGYKRHTSLKDHIKLRHEKSKEDFSCSLCSYTFTYRTQLDRHMNTHKNGRDQSMVSHSGGNRKFKCTECSKAFKYKHHLKEHLRIHSGEKPYECSNCKKRFSHSGSYSSHISSKKCVAVPPAINGVSHSPGIKAALTLTRPSRILLPEKLDIDKPLEEHLSPKKIKEEPDEHELKPDRTTSVVTTTTVTSTSTTTNGGGISVQTAPPQGVVQTLLLPTVGLVQPISINLRDLQNMLKVAVDGNMMWQSVPSSNANGTCSKVVNQGQPQAQAMIVQTAHSHLQVISAISLPVLDQDGNSKIIINYSVDPQINTSDLNTEQSALPHQTVAQAKVQECVAPPEVGKLISNKHPKTAQTNTTQPNVTPTPKPPTSRPVPAQISILKSTQSAVPNKATSIIKVTKLVPGQTKHTQPALLLLKTVNGSPGLVVRQLAAVNPQVTPTIGTTHLKSTPEYTIMEAKQNSPIELSTRGEETSSPRDRCQPADLGSTFLQGIQLKTESESEIKTDCEETLQIVKERKEGLTAQSDLTTAHKSVVCGDGFHNYATCLFCDNSPSSTDILNYLNSNEQGSDKCLSSLLGKENVESTDQPPVKSLLPLLEAYSKNSHPSEEQLSQVAELVSLPVDVVSRWFQRMRLKNILLQNPENPRNGQETIAKTQQEPSMDTNTQILDNSAEPNNEESGSQNSDLAPLNFSTNYLGIIKTEDLEEKGQVEPLDLSLPKSSCCNGNTSVTNEESATKPSVTTQEEPINLTCFKKDTLDGNTIYVTQSTTSPINIIATPLPTLVAIAEPGGIPCLRPAISTKQRTILIPQLSYTYTSPSTNNKANTTTPSSSKATTMTTPPTTDTQGGVKNAGQEKTDAGDESLSGREGLNDSNLSPNKKRRKMHGGQYACDLCDKIFQKSSSLLRHKYEHTGKRPHECGVCKKAFKHKHHLIEHSRLHSGEKPYQCDKCGKRFSHSGSYSQHMNHRYSYCKKEVYDQPEPNNTSSTPPSQLDSDERESEAEEDIYDDEEPEGEKDCEEDFSGFDMSDIRVVRVGEEYYEEEEEEVGRAEKKQVTQDPVELSTLEKEVVKTLGMEDMMDSKAEEEIKKQMKNDLFNDTVENN